jgi:hypothetical protein
MSSDEIMIDMTDDETQDYTKDIALLYNTLPTIYSENVLKVHKFDLLNFISVERYDDYKYITYMPASGIDMIKIRQSWEVDIPKALLCDLCTLYPIKRQ